ncbi:GNAT family protein [uncultured Odoribacter sp.]|uniref:GNAT family N-acetyltransferase n=1 Tax=uncultured Odoribacter sp. TaxID=876416 RepID=UPI00261DDECF|nr:GNAT family protein [uncultured Odoribacter sp.]
MKRQIKNTEEQEKEYQGHFVRIEPDFFLREATLEDAAEIWQTIFENRDDLRTWLPFVDNLREVADEEKFLECQLSVPYEERNIVFVINHGPEICGLIGFVTTDNLNHRTEIGYWLIPKYRGAGLMTRCVRHLCEWAIRERGMNRIQIRCAVGNHPSNAIPQRLNFIFEGTEREGEWLTSGKYADLNVYSILKSEIENWEK